LSEYAEAAQVVDPPTLTETVAPVSQDPEIVSKLKAEKKGEAAGAVMTGTAMLVL